MAKALVPLTMLSEAQRAQAYARFPRWKMASPRRRLLVSISFPRVRSNAGPRAFSQFRQRVSEVLREEFREQRPITTTEAEHLVWADLEVELLALPVSCHRKR